MPDRHEPPTRYLPRFAGRGVAVVVDKDGYQRAVDDFVDRLLPIHVDDEVWEALRASVANDVWSVVLDRMAPRLDREAP